MKKVLASALVCLVAVAAISANAEDKEKPKKVGPTCPVSGKACKTEFAADYKGAKVYFCCEGCIKKFQQGPEEYKAALLERCANLALSLHSRIKLGFERPVRLEDGDLITPVSLGLVHR